MTDLVKAFSKHLEAVGRKQGLAKVFNDVLTMGICSFHRVNIQSRLTEKDEANEALYFEIIKPYNKEELTELAKALGVLQLNVLKNPYSDILGDYFTLHITRGQNGQFFTPDPVCEFMAAITHGDKNKKGARVFDPACGSGRMLLAAAKNSPDNLFFGADNDQTCAHMATLNFFLNGLRGRWLG
ncbi:SAM-dependent DNA methyltransferase [Flavobacterium arcticum]|uniref:SAM-dependent DNA methyltransferase n=1 Tax=Flavobacterium arcticum TaxID=1784713 RepID=A0A345H8S7_9FLAO|nr:N-6 DNA methylase [Flavobacterium arcticum]AXG72987.1 SAM-dependent DNA methyltransferase [Flavobacterium arcticum]KAF2510349.1 SAM-dependent DNA methyltransferase [Flavobacterium arcticum]